MSVSAFDWFIAILKLNGLRLASMKEGLRSVLEQDEKGKEQWVPKSYKEVHLVSWNVQNIDQITHLCVSIDGGTWSDLFEKVEKEIEEVTKRNEVCEVD